MLKTGKLKGALQPGSRTWVSIIACISSDGTYLPPSVIYQGGGGLQSSWIQDFDAEQQRCYFASTPSGFSNDDLAFDWLTNVFDKATKQKARNGRDWRLLLLDGHSSHINITFLDWCYEHRILVAIFPPHATHRLQPLDISLFAPLAVRYSQGLLNWINITGSTLNFSQRDFFALFWTAFEQAFTKDNIQSSWAKTGLAPFRPEVVLDQVKEDS